MNPSNNDYWVSVRGGGSRREINGFVGRWMGEMVFIGRRYDSGNNGPYYYYYYNYGYYYY